MLNVHIFSKACLVLNTITQSCELLLFSLSLHSLLGALVEEFVSVHDILKEFPLGIGLVWWEGSMVGFNILFNKLSNLELASGVDLWGQLN